MLIMETHLMYDGRKYEIQGHTEHGNGSLTVDLKPVRELPPEPPQRTVLFDDSDVAWQRWGSEWRNALGDRLTWRELLEVTDLRNVMVAGKATDTLVRVRPDSVVQKSHAPGETHLHLAQQGVDEVVHGYFERLED